MNTTEFISHLPVTIDRAQVISQLQAQQANATENVLPAFNAAREVFNKQYSFQSSLGRKIEAALVRQRMSNNRVNWVSDVATVLENIIESVPYMIGEIEKLKTPTIARDAIDLRTANIIQLAETYKFILSYAPQLLLWVYSAEGASESATVNEAFSSGTRTWLTENLSGFVSLICLYIVKPGEIKKRLDTVAKVPVSGIDFDVASAIDWTKVDPMRMGLVGVDQLQTLVSRISYRIGRMWAEYSVRCYNEQRELKNALDLRLIELRMAQNGETDAVLTKKIKYTEDRLAKLSYEIKQYEER